MLLTHLTLGSPGVARTISTGVQRLSLVIQDARCGRNGGLGHTGSSTTWGGTDPGGRSDKPTLVLSSLLVGRAAEGTCTQANTHF